MSYSITASLLCKDTTINTLSEKSDRNTLHHVDLIELQIDAMTTESLTTFLSVCGIGEIKDINPLLPIKLTPVMVSQILERIKDIDSEQATAARSILTNRVVAKLGLTIS